MRSIDLNSDLGEGAGADDEIMAAITSANIACGAHAGDVETMRRSVASAVRGGVAIGAHPGYRDPANFGRVALDMPRSALFADLVAQIEGLQGIADEAGSRVTHVKAHGALYNRGERDPEIAAVIADAVRTVGADLVLFAPSAAQALALARDGGVRAFDGTLVRLEVDTICVHGDTPNAPAIVRAVRDALGGAGIGVRPFALAPSRSAHRTPSVE